MNAASWAVASRMTPFSSSLIAPSPPSLSKVPTLAELHKHAQSVRTSIMETVPAYMPKSHTSSNIPIRPGRGANPASSDLEGSPPPLYTRHDPLKLKQMGNKLKKNKSGWKKIQERIPGEDQYSSNVAEGDGQRHDGMTDVYLGQGKLSQTDRPKGCRGQKTWWQWLSCRG